jgi:excisionase family DNA binding protein
MQQPVQVDPIAVSIAHACQMLGLSRYSVCRLIRNGQIRMQRAGRRVLIPCESIRDFLRGSP